MIEATAAALWAVGAGILAPGACVVRAAGIGRGTLERALLALAIGRVLLIVVTLLATSFGVARAMPLWGALSLTAYLVLRWRDRRVRPLVPRLDAASLAPLAPPIAASLLLVAAVTAGSGLTQADGALVFYGRDASADSLFYLALARGLGETGLPLANPLISSFPASGHLGVFALLAGLQKLGGGVWLDLAFRVVPLLNVLGLALGAHALARALGASPWGASIGATLLAVGADLSWPARAASTLFGVESQDLLAWALYGPYLLPFNPGSAAGQIVFAACLLLARLPDGGVRAAAIAGLLFGSTALIKVPLWAPFVAALALVALRPPPMLARPTRIAALVAIAASLPSHLDTVWNLLLRSKSEQLLLGFGACVGCLPRFLTDLTFRGHGWSFEHFETFRWADLLAPSTWLAIAGSTLVLLVVGLGARLLALPTLVRGCRFGDGAPDGGALTQRVLLAAAAIGVGLACTVAAAPHYLNGGQFAWSASFGLWIPFGVAAGGWIARKRFAWTAFGLALALASSWRWIHDHAWLAPAVSTVSADERALVARLEELSQPRDLVLEASWFTNEDWLSPVPWLAGRPVYLSSGAIVDYLPTWAQIYRAGNLHHVFRGERRDAALTALRATEARWVYAPAALPLRFDASGALEEVARNPAGVIYRVSDPDR